MKAYKNAKTVSAQEGETLIEAGLKQATSVPLGVAEKAAGSGGDRAEPVRGYESQHEVRLDDGAGTGAGCDYGSAGNVEINLASLKDQAFAGEVRKRVEIMAVS